MSSLPKQGLQEQSSENSSVSIVDLLDFSIKMKWFYGHVDKNIGSPLGIDDIADSSNRDYIIFHCCEELELLSREYSNDEVGVIARWHKVLRLTQVLKIPTSY